MRMCCTSKVDHQLSVQQYFSVNESLLLLIYQVITVSGIWQPAKIDLMKNVKRNF